ncbi:MAG: isoprenylcysteine carboxylmethyltransferase family protein [Isosphaeraceae bacterium]
MTARLSAFVYGVLCYLVFFVSFVYSVGFIGDWAVPRSIDRGPEAPLGQALLIDAALLGLFAVQHSVMARPAFKRVWTRVVPEPVERATYVLFSSLALLLLFWQWRPVGGVLWDVEAPAARGLIHGVYFLGWVLLLASTCMIDHFDLFGLRQVWRHLQGKAQAGLEFRTPGLYKHIRHPIYLSWFCIFWATPRMSTAHLVFAVMTTAYILVAVRFEERDLIRAYGDDYRRYRDRVPMIFPRRRPATPPADALAPVPVESPRVADLATKTMF